LRHRRPAIIVLDESNPALLYLDSELAEHFPTAYRSGRDSLAVSHGLLLFSRRRRPPVVVASGGGRVT